MTRIDYTFTLEARDVPGMLVRITQVYARRGCNISLLNVSPEKRGQWYVIDVEAFDVERPAQIVAQLQKLVDVNRVTVSKRTLEEVH
jgi:acetolactate synthase regulatory subunit